MVGRVLLAAALVWVAGLLVACAGGPAALTLGSAPWQDGEVARYDILDREGNRVGGATFSVGRDGDSWLLSEDDAVGAVKQSSRVRLDGTTLRPQSGQKEIHAPGTEATVRYTYAGENLEIKAVVNGEDRAATVNVPENTLDNDQFLMTLRAIPFAEGYAGSTLVVVPASATRVSAIVRVLGKE
ncbi:MAG: DUF3108 domain-containing protein, partial [Anaerolineae bacterium]|nr:DUF3108 domain-containing protein [Anaerolineae bacterium]